MDIARFNHHPRTPRRRRGAAKKGGLDAQKLGRSRGGFGTKIHAVTDALGLPLRLILGPGQQNDMAPARELVTGLSADNVLADRAYDADHLFELIRSQGGTPVIPPRRHRKIAHAYDQDLYKARSDIECFFSKIKHFRRIATRYDKLAAVYLGFVKIAAIHVWLR